MRTNLKSRCRWLALAFLAVAACGEDPSYTLRWRFADQEPAPFSARSCGVRGVESFLGTETEAGGGVRNFRVVCGMGQLRRTLPEGVWTVTLTGRDPAGRVLLATSTGPDNIQGQAGPFALQGEEPEPIVEVVVAARQACSDRIDNDHDGLLDAEDPACQQGSPQEGTSTP